MVVFQFVESASYATTSSSTGELNPAAPDAAKDQVVGNGSFYKMHVQKCCARWLAACVVEDYRSKRAEWARRQERKRVSRDS